MRFFQYQTRRIADVRPIMMMVAVLTIVALVSPQDASPPITQRIIERVTTIAPYPRGLAMVDGKLFVLCRGRVRGVGGVSAAIDDQAGTIYVVNPDITESIGQVEISEAVRTNGRIFAKPTTPPFQLWNRNTLPPEADRLTDRPYCTLRYHEPTQSFFICAFSGIDKQRTKDDPVAFSKNLSDAVLRYDLRTQSWDELERHDIEAGGNYPHHDPKYHDPPHGWLNGPDNCLALGDGLYVVSKENSLLVRYDLSALRDNPHAEPLQCEVILDQNLRIKGIEQRAFNGTSALAFDDGWLYVGYRTCCVIIRIQLDEAMMPVLPMRAQLIAQFDAFDPRTGHSANVTDIGFDDVGHLFVLCAEPARVFRFTPDSQHVFDARYGKQKPWINLAERTGISRMKSENLLYFDGWLYVTSGNGYDYQDGAHGTVYRVCVDD